MRRWLPFVVPFAVVLAVGVGLRIWQLGGVGAVDTSPGEWLGWDELDLTDGNVRISGMAHYQVVVEQHVPGSLFRDPQTLYVYGLFEPYDTESRMIRLIVRTPREPEHLVSYELMTVEGRLVRSTPDKIPYDVEIKLGERSDYYFADEMLLIEPVVIEVGLDPRATPEP